MASKEDVKAELRRLSEEGTNAIKLLKGDFAEAHAKFIPRYQSWYTASLQLVRTFAADRLAEFRSYYEIDPKRKDTRDATYSIQDFVYGLGPGENPTTGKPYFNALNVLQLRLFSQVTILQSLASRIDGILADVETALAAGLEDSALSTAASLAKVSPRAGGALAGVVIEGHLQRVAVNRDVKVPKKNPTIADLNDPLKASGVYDTPTWRRIQYLADLRNLCAHNKDRDPTSTEANELIEGANWVVKNVL